MDKMIKHNFDGSMDLSQMSYDERYAYGRGHNDCLNKIVYQCLVEEKGDVELYKEIVGKFNEYVISKDCFGIDP